jgi:hypothetical protein
VGQNVAKECLQSLIRQIWLFVGAEFVVRIRYKAQPTDCFRIRLAIAIKKRPPARAFKLLSVLLKSAGVRWVSVDKLLNPVVPLYSDDVKELNIGKRIGRSDKCNRKSVAIYLFGPVP